MYNKLMSVAIIWYLVFFLCLLVLKGYADLYLKIFPIMLSGAVLDLLLNYYAAKKKL